METKKDSTATPKFIVLAEDRYRKGIELIRLLHEKILGLDHHFSSLQSTHGLHKLTNPHNYPAFQLMVDKLDKSTRKKFNQMPEVWQSNPFLVSGVLRADLMNNLSSAEAEKLGCLLDFTSRMYSDLNMIFYETQYLRMSNEELKTTCSHLFKEYAKVIGYEVSLEDCRKNDDWETITIYLQNYIHDMTDKHSGTQENKKVARQMHMDISFPLNSILDFIDRYTVFISDGKKHYQKFQMILESYKNNEICADHLPERFQQLQAETAESIEKFAEAYRVAELKGSKLKDLIFAVVD